MNGFILRGRILHKIMKRKTYSAYSHWNLRIRLRILIFLVLHIQYEMCYTNILQILDLSQHSAGCSVSVKEMTRLSLAAVPAPIIRSRLQISLICSISERAKLSMIRIDLSGLYKQCRQAKSARQEFLDAVQRIFRESMCRLYMR